MRQKVPGIQILCFRLLDRVDKRVGNLLVRGGLHEDPERKVLDQICQPDFPWHSQERKVIYVTEVISIT